MKLKYGDGRIDYEIKKNGVVDVSQQGTVANAGELNSLTFTMVLDGTIIFADKDSNWTTTNIKPKLDNVSCF